MVKVHPQIKFQMKFKKWVLLKPVQKLFNTFLKSGHFPAIWNENIWFYYINLVTNLTLLITEVSLLLQICGNFLIE